MYNTKPEGPGITCLAGPARFAAEWRAAWITETSAGRVVVGTPDLRAEIDAMHQGQALAAVEALSAAHMKLIDMADELLVVSDETGYLGDATYREIRYATDRGIPVRFAVPAAEAQWMAIEEGVTS